MKHKRIMMFILTSVLLINLTACGGGEGIIPTETVENLFDQPIPTTIPPETAGTTNLSEKATQRPCQFEKTLTYEHGGLRFTGGVQTVEYGTLFDYNGGEMRMSFALNYEGSVVEYGLGVILFLDGQPQAYKLTEDGEYSYMHMVYPESGVDTNLEVFFVPCAGKTGDVLEVYLSVYLFPGHSDYEKVGFSSRGPEYCGAGAQIKFNTDAEKAGYPDGENRLLSYDITYQETSWSDMNGWSTEELRKNVKYRFMVDGSSNYLKYGYIPENGKMNLQFEIWGNPDMEYGLVLFVDDQLVTTDESEFILFGIEEGMTTVVEMSVDMSGYDGECSVVYVLVPRNYLAMPESKLGNGIYYATPAYKRYAWSP